MVDVRAAVAAPQLARKLGNATGGGQNRTVSETVLKKKGSGDAPPFCVAGSEAYFGMSVGSAPSFGAPVPDEPMNSLRPSGKVTSRPLALQIGVQALSFD